MPSPTPKYDAPKNKFLGAAQMLHFSNGLYFDLPQKNQGLAKKSLFSSEGQIILSGNSSSQGRSGGIHYRG